MSAESNDGWNLAVKVTLASTGKNKKSDMTRSHKAAKQNGPVEGEELAGSNDGWNLTVKVTMGKNKESKNKGSPDATKQNGPVEGEETLAAAGASADAKESPPDECRKTCDVQDISYHGQDVLFQLEIDGGSDGVTMEIVTNGQTASFGSTDHAQKTEEADMHAVGGSESISMEVTTEEQVASQDTTVHAGQSEGEDLESDDEEGDVSLELATSGQVASLDTAACGLLSKGEDVADNEDSCPWKHVEDDSSETKVNKNQSHKGGNQHQAQKGGNQQHSQKGGNQQQPSKDSLPTQRDLIPFGFGRGRGRLPANSSQDERGRVVEKDKSNDTTSSHKSDHSRSRDRSCDGAKGGVRDRSHSGSRHSSQGCDNQEEDWRYYQKVKQEARQQEKWQNDKRSQASQREQAQGGKENQKGDNQNRLERLRRERPPRQGEPIELVEIVGNLFSCPATDAMAHCVSEDLVMGKGIAVLFKEAFHGVDDLKAQAKKVGDVATLYRDGNYVYYLIIKSYYFQKPTYQTLKSSLTAMKNHMVEHKVTHLSMPTIGCGHDDLVWDFVADIIKDVFHGTGIQITIYHYDGK